ncbi:molybdate ABC transporter substrate-binding protein [Vibrio palustris]|uniref:Molybdate-binding periplasmic protein n=1 Tax=Vibrio palustris TaxID=1918946 RepID=A0A1R4B6Y1_9VIBR|nr:molybdate ABC transporter substrate-binding protein [Vibrio palustris]SJL84678.1 Molybdate-binding periplasmic protein precursor [Vibrio palustris]
MKTILVLFLSIVLSHSVWAQSVIHLYAASSMTNAVNELVSDYHQQHPNIRVVPVFGSSSSLARQIEHGAPADVYLSANEKWVHYLVNQGTVSAANVRLLVGNDLVLIQPSDLPAAHFDVGESSAWQAKLDDSRLAVGNTQAVPAGIYARETLQSLGVWQAVQPRLAQTNNVRLALALVERGEAPLGIVYKTDALQSDLVSIVHTFAESHHDPIHYPLVTLSQTPQVDDFVAYMHSTDAQKTLKKYGFNTHLGQATFKEH